VYILYIANKNYSSWSLRPWVLMKALGVPFEERVTPFSGHSNREGFRQFSPTGMVPCLHDGPTVVWDSLAISEYLAERHSGVWPVEPEARAFARCAAAEMHSGFSALRSGCSMSCGLRVRLHETSPALQLNLDRLAELWGEGLARFGGPFLAGSVFTAADAFYAPVAFRVQTYGLNLPGVAGEYARRLLDLPALKSWYVAALQEPWRDEAHEIEVFEAGTVLQDLRSPPGS
jgi:glutathione S-transferase